MAEAVGVLAGAACVAAAHGDLLAPDGARGARSEDVVLGAEEEVRDKLAADAGVPRIGVGGEGAGGVGWGRIS